MNRVYWDSMVFIYLLEANPEFGDRVRGLHANMRKRGDRLCTGVFSIGEVLTGPRKRNRPAEVQAIKSFFLSDEIQILPFHTAAADHYSIIRATMLVSQADAIHLATAGSAGIDVFVTNDERLRKLSVPGIRFMMDLDGKIY